MTALTFRQALMKGYPGYRYDQPRDERGRWSGGSGSAPPAGGYHTADVVLFDRRGRVLLIRRGKNPFKGHYALPGGFVNPGEDTRAAARRELEEETGLKIGRLRLVGTYDKPGRDPRGQITSTVYTAVVRQDVDARAGDDASGLAWVKNWRRERLAFDHKQILADTARRRRR